MDLDEFTPSTLPATEPLTSLASKIRPLPDEVAPSPEFLQRTRQRLLHLSHPSRRPDRQAA